MKVMNMGSVAKISDYCKFNEPVAAPYEATEIFQSDRVRIFHSILAVHYVSGHMQHMHCDKRLIVLDGSLLVHMRTGVHRILKDEEFMIPATEVHTIRNAGHIPLKLVELRTGCYVADDELMKV
ncbi:MAG: hypothetical protein AAF429_05875 [Pseudomonadota bacterium]